MQNEKYFFYHYNEFECNHDLKKIDDALLVYKVLYEKDYYIFFCFE